MTTQNMVVYCFDVLCNHFRNIDIPFLNMDNEQEYPFFVTWEKENEGRLELRGCIGTLVPTPLSSLKDYALKSALNDHRFPSIQESELHQLHCTVSLLMNYELAANIEDWEVGIHGIIITFSDERGKEYRATYLPDVASSQNWNQSETIRHLIRKAGYTGVFSKTLLERIVVTRYSNSKMKLSYQEYITLKALQEDHH